MNRRILGFAAATAVLLASPSWAQQTEGEQGFHSQLRLQSFRYGNFFQTSNVATQEDVNAAGAELRLFFRPTPAPLDLYAWGNYSDWRRSSLDNSYGGRVGVRNIGKVNRFDVYADIQKNRPSFEVGSPTDLVETFATADVDTYNATYSVLVTHDWEPGIQGTYQRQRYDLARSNDNHFAGGDVSLRYRGFGYVFSPEVGVGRGTRTVVNPNEDYDQDEWYVMARSIPVKPLYLGLRYRNRTRDYSTSDIALRNFGRVDHRKQWALTADLKMGRIVTWNLYYSREKVVSSRANRDFNTDLLLLGLSLGF